MRDMETRASRWSQRRHAAQRRGWRGVALVVACVLLAHQIAVMTPLLGSMAPDVSSAAPVATDAACAAACLPTILRVCAPARACAVVWAAFTHSPSLPLMVLAFILFTALAVRLPVAPHVSGWRWPAERRRAFLQVFLI